MSSLSQLKSALLSNRGEDIRYALSAYLKEDVRASSELLRPEPIEKSCGAGVDANACASVITSCLEGGNVGQCVSTLESISAQLKGGMKGMNSELALKVCKNLGIQINAKDPLGEWLSRIAVSDAAAASKIGANSVLVLIISSFIVAAQNPLVDSRSFDFTQARIALGATIKAKTPRINVKVQSGGGMARSTFNKYVQYADSLKTVVSMRGGAEQPILNKTYDELANIYNNFVNSLRAQNKQIDANDNERIRQLLSELKYTEEKLQKVVQYIAKYNQVKNHPSFKDELATNPVTASLLEDLNKKYEALQEKQKKKVYNFLSISDALNKAISDVEEIKEKLNGPSGPSGPSGLVSYGLPSSVPSGLVSAPPSSRLAASAASPVSPASPASPATAPVPAASGLFGSTDFRQANAARQAANSAVARADALEWDMATRAAAKNAGNATANKYFNW